MKSARTRILRSLAAACLLAAPLLASTATPASAAQFRYWALWGSDGSSWVASSPDAPPESHQLIDGAVDGWRFGIWDDTGPNQAPRTSAVFATLCPTLASSTAPAGSIRVAVVIDPGTTDDAPTGEQPGPTRRACLTLPANATSAQALSAASRNVRLQNGQVCAVDGYPANECVPQISGPTPSFTGELPSTATADTNVTPSQTTDVTESQQKSSWSKVAPVLLGALGAVLLIGGALLAFSQRNQR